MNRIGRPYVFTAFDAVCIVGLMLSLIINACGDVSPGKAHGWRLAAALGAVHAPRRRQSSPEW
ncbi:hypothetical protein [Sinorhizobium meliloti]|uniref:hypothetical protein n=1 Tax=Rhizobium meliloti TaxID=382 RepID=UPI000FD75141|nr:hypothetical protein [Sinorhizobium meliloti]MDW9370995.1 hypothetical protein [Sinorhizobium meliloti]MDW9546370.1 hypothetical protein [Sinorhizobium meliloti]RVO92321.1 hypothetical protein CN089_21475 [Sinorhizobium meliloti]RVQ09913.1 hypothetical protein CN096_19175 [Sinorhizobium meliloti]